MSKYIFNGGADSWFSTDFDYATQFTEDLTSTLIVQGTLIGALAQDYCFVSSSSGTPYVILTVNRASQRLEGELRDDLGNISSDKTAWVNDGLEHQFAFTYDGIDFQTYVDGIELGTSIDSDFTGAIAGPLLMQIGKERHLATNMLDGDISAIKYYNTALDTTALLEIFNDITSNDTIYLGCFFHNQKTLSTWTDEVAGYIATNQGGVTLEAAATTTVEIEWVDSISAAATGNKIYRDDVEIADVAKGVQFYSDPDAPVASTPKYEVQAHDGAGDETTKEEEGKNMAYITTA